MVQVRIEYGNMEGGGRSGSEVANQFDKYTFAEMANLGIGYDYGSILHYSPYAFSIQAPLSDQGVEYSAEQAGMDARRSWALRRGATRWASARACPPRTFPSSRSSTSARTGLPSFPPASSLQPEPVAV